jgi:hypothetical protein
VDVDGLRSGVGVKVRKIAGGIGGDNRGTQIETTRSPIALHKT